MKPRFKPGPAKTRDGSDAYIFEVSDKIYGKVNFGDDDWRGQSWWASGRLTVAHESCLDLMPNCEPEIFVADSISIEASQGRAWIIVNHSKQLAYWDSMKGKNYRMTLEEICDD